MQEALRMAGFFAAHGMWTLAEAPGPMSPMLAEVDPEGERRMSRFVSDDIEQSIELARERLEENPEDARCATIVTDGYLTIEETRTDALLLDVRDHGSGIGMVIAVPYRPCDHEDGFAVHTLQFLSFQGPGDADDPDVDALADAFFAGVDEHEEGSELWESRFEELPE